ncbi:MAG: SIS domain-containing protein [Verrucomicrobiota bacterium]
MNHVAQYLEDAASIAAQIDQEVVEQMIQKLIAVRENNGRLFILGVGGSAGNASHAVCDFRKLAEIEAYAPLDNISELTARTNDEGWETVVAEWLKISKLCLKDLLMVFSVGGGDAERNISANLVSAIDLAKSVGAGVIGVAGRDGGYTGKMADAAVIVPTVNTDTVTAHAESFQTLIWHLIISDPRIQRVGMKWESNHPLK